VRYEVSSSSLTGGQLQQQFAYSVDSGATWTAAGLNMTADSIGVNWSVIALDFGNDQMVNNNPRLAFRIRFAGNTTGSSGNNRFDNFTVEGDTMIVTPPPPPDTTKLIHYWHFNAFSGTYTNPDIPHIDADYSVLDTSKAQVVYQLDPGTSATYAGHIDQVTGDTLNARMGQAAGNGLRVRNPSDSMSLLLYIPTTHYKNIKLKYEVQASSLTSGQLQENFDYSVDSGMTWKTAGLNKTSDSTSVNWKLESLSFGSDTTVNNNSGLVFRIRFAGNTTGTSGNNRFDNITVEGDALTAATDTGNYVNNINTVHNTCTLYPNPAADQIFISTPADNSKTISIYNVAGQKVYGAYRNEQLVSIQVATLKAGMYYITVHDNKTGEDYVLKFIKQ
jgi:heat shock protein HslJ